MPGRKVVSPGEAEICGTAVEVSVDGFLRSVYSRDDGDGKTTDMCQVIFETDNGPGGFQAVPVPRRLVSVRVAKAYRGAGV